MRVAISGRRSFGRAEVQVADRVESLPLRPVADAVGIRQVEDRIAARAERHALISRRQKAADHRSAPPRGPRGPDCSTTKPGRSCDSLPIP